MRKVDGLALVFLVNLIGAPTGVGWLGAMIMAFGPRRPPPRLHCLLATGYLLTGHPVRAAKQLILRLRRAEGFEANGVGFAASMQRRFLSCVR